MELSFMINVIIGVLIVSMFFSILNQKKPDLLTQKKGNRRYEKVRAINRKADEDLLGRRLSVPRDGRDEVAVNLYEISSDQPTPVVYVVHGGNLFDGDADQCDTFCHRMSRLWNCMIIAINYTKLDVQVPPYQQDEIIDTVEYFSSRSAFYHIDPSRSAFVGFSGGAYLMMGAAAILHTKGMDLKGMISFYPLIDDSSIQLVDQGIYRTPITFITCENQQEIQMVDHLVSHLEQAGVQTDVRNYSAAVTGFIEVNNPEYEQNRYYQKGRDQMYTQDQKDYAAACEIWMAGVLERYFEKEN